MSGEADGGDFADRETTRYSYDNPDSELPTGIVDATGSSRTIRRNRYGQMVAFTDCSGYETRYEYNRFGQMTAVHREEGLSVYRTYNTRGLLVSQKEGQAGKPAMTITRQAT